MESPLNVTTIIEGQWYQVLLEDNVTIEYLGEQGSSLIPSGVELAYSDLEESKVAMTGSCSIKLPFQYASLVVTFC